MAAFAIGEVEAASGADALLAVLKKTNQPLSFGREPSKR
jgi:hypothetical protein